MRYEFITYFVLHYGELYRSYAMRQFSLVLYRAQCFLLRMRIK